MSAPTTEEARVLARQWGPTRIQDDLTSAERERLFAWVRERMAEYAAGCPAKVYIGWNASKPGHADDMAGWIASDLGIGEDLDDDEAIALAKPLCEAAGWPT